MALKYNQSWTVMGVIRKLMQAILGLYVGGTMLGAFGNAMVNTSSALYTGLSLIGWTVRNSLTNGTAGYYIGCGITGVSTTLKTNCLTATTGGAILSVLGIVSIASVVMEFFKY